MGNVLLQDEGVGVYAIRALQQALPDCRGELAILDGGTCPDVLSLLPEGIERLIVVDAVRGGCEPGTLYRFTPGDVAFRPAVATSAHQLGMAEALKMMQDGRVRPAEVVIIGVEPKEIAWGLALTPELQASIPQIIDLLTSEIARPPSGD